MGAVVPFAGRDYVLAGRYLPTVPRVPANGSMAPFVAGRASRRVGTCAPAGRRVRLRVSGKPRKPGGRVPSTL